MKLANNKVYSKIDSWIKTYVEAIKILRYTGLSCVIYFVSLQAVAATLEIEVASLGQQPVLLFLESDIAENIQTPKPITSNPKAKITSAMLQFDPPLQVLAVGTIINVENKDTVLHNTHIFDNNRTLFNIATPNTTASVQRTLRRPGLFGVRCDLHPTMNAWIAVVGNAYYTVIEKPGIYKIEGIQAGSYAVHIQQAYHQEKIMQMNLQASEDRKILLPL